MRGVETKGGKREGEMLGVDMRWEGEGYWQLRSREV